MMMARVAGVPRRAKFFEGRAMSPSNRHVIPDQVLSCPEPLPEAEPLAVVPATPFAFIRFLIKRHFRWQIFALVGLAGSATSIEAFGPYALSHLINAITAPVAVPARFATAILPWMTLLAAIWLGSTLAYRSYEAVGVVTSPPLRAPAAE